MASTSKCSIGVYLNEECHKTTYNSQIGSRHIDRFDYKDQLLIKPRCGIDKPLTDICNQHEPQVQLYFTTIPGGTTDLFIMMLQLCL